ncbi:hypothetical protein HG531_009057 [Fusarium graminearum]|nr:hypothetical protein HG531_009057 [Fusarium graminearum]
MTQLLSSQLHLSGQDTAVSEYLPRLHGGKSSAASDRCDALQRLLLPIRGWRLTDFELVRSPIFKCLCVLRGIKEVGSSGEHVAIDRMVFGRQVLDIHAFAQSHDPRAGVLAVPDILKSNTLGYQDLSSEGCLDFNLASLELGNSISSSVVRVPGNASCTVWNLRSIDPWLAGANVMLLTVLAHRNQAHIVLLVVRGSLPLIYCTNSVVDNSVVKIVVCLLLVRLHWAVVAWACGIGAKGSNVCYAEDGQITRCMLDNRIQNIFVALLPFILGDGVLARAVAGVVQTRRIREIVAAGDNVCNPWVGPIKLRSLLFHNVWQNATTDCVVGEGPLSSIVVRELLSQKVANPLVKTGSFSV